MSHTVTAKLNSAARQHQNQAGTTFFVSLGEKNYDHKTKQSVWTNYDAALFAKDGQVEFYANALVENAIVSVSGTGIILDASNPEYKPKLVIQDAKLGFVHSPQGQAPQQRKQGQSNSQGFNNQGQQYGQTQQDQQAGSFNGQGQHNQQQRPMDQAMKQNQGGFPQDNEPPF